MATNIPYGNTAATSPKQQFIESLGSPQTYNFMNESVVANPTTNEVISKTSNTPSPVTSTSSTPKESSYSGYTNAFQKYISSLTPSAPSDEVIKAKTAYNDYVANQDKSISGLEGQGRGIPLSIVRGTQEKLLKQTQPEAARLQNAISIAQDSENAQRDYKKSLSEQALAGIDYEKSLLDLTRADEKEAQTLKDRERELQSESSKFALQNDIKTPFYTVAGTTYRTSDNKPFSSQEEFFAAGGARDFSNAPTISIPTKPIEVSAGASLIDPTTGKILSTAPKIAAPRATSGSSTSTTPNNDVDNYANAVYTGSLKLSGVPQKLRGTVDARVKELQKSAESTYDTEFEARVDYDRELTELAAAIAAGNTLNAKPSEIINTLYQDYGKRISKEEITATVYNILGIKK